MTAICLLTLMLSLQGAAERAKGLASRVTFTKPATGTPEGRKVVSLLTDQRQWAAGFRTVESKLGPFADNTELQVTFDYAGREFVKMTGKTTIRFNFTKVEAYQKRLDELALQRKKLALQGKRMRFRLPPAKMERFIPHELTHALQKQRGVEAPEWFDEGLAQWVGDDPNVLIGFALAGKKVERIGTPPSAPDDVYARGHLFFKWLEARGALRKAVRLSFYKGVEWKKALEEATGLAWKEIVDTEKKWSGVELEKLRTKAR